MPKKYLGSYDIAKLLGCSRYRGRARAFRAGFESQIWSERQRRIILGAASPIQFEPKLNAKRFKSDLKASLLEITPAGRDIRTVLIRNFHVVAGIVQQVTGIVLSKNLARELLRTYLANRMYQWPDATINNLPWLLARAGCNFSLYGRRLRPNSRLCNAILNSVPEARLVKGDQLIARTGTRLYLHFGIRSHRVFEDAKGQQHGRVTLFVTHEDGNITSTRAPVFEEVPRCVPEIVSRTGRTDDVTARSRTLAQGSGTGRTRPASGSHSRRTHAKRGLG